MRTDTDLFGEVVRYWLFRFRSCSAKMDRLNRPLFWGSDVTVHCPSCGEAVYVNAGYIVTHVRKAYRDVEVCGASGTPYVACCTG